MQTEPQAAKERTTEKVFATWVAFTITQDEVLVQRTIEQNDKHVAKQVSENHNEVLPRTAGRVYDLTSRHVESYSEDWRLGNEEGIEESDASVPTKEKRLV